MLKLTQVETERVRVQLDFTLESLERFDQLKVKVGADTRAEVIRQALRLYEWFVNETKPDTTIVILDEEGQTTLTFSAMLLHSAIKPGP